MIWRRNCPHFYQLLYSTELDWPSLTVDWIPDKDITETVTKSQN